MKKIAISALILIAGFSCSKRSIEKTPLLMLLQKDARTQYVSYVTNEKKELLHDMNYINRTFVRSDTIADKIVHHFIERNQMARFYIDKVGTLFQEIKVDLGGYALNAGFPYREPVMFSFWKPMFKRDDGFGTTWAAKAQQNFVAYDSLGNAHTIKYMYEGEATLAGWEDVIVPANYGNIMKTLHVKWTRFSNTLFDVTEGRVIWQQKGKGGDYYDPDIGLLRSTADYTIKKRDEPELIRKSTFELYLLIAGTE